jgi:hypothetical protein
MFLSFAFIMNLDHAMVGITIGMVEEAGFWSKNPRSTNANKTFVGCSIWTCCLTSMSP